MKNYTITIEVSIRDCLKFQNYFNDLEIVYGFKIEKIYSNVYICNGEEWLSEEEVESIVTELEEIFIDYEVEITYEINY
jgi:hypothetical protein